MPIVRVELLPGRTNAQKAEYTRQVTKLTAELLNCSVDSVSVMFTVIEAHDWGNAGKMYSAPAEPAN